MKYKQIIALPILGLAFSGMVHAGALPLLSSISSANNVGVEFVKPLDVDYTFNNRGLNVAVAPKDGGGYTLTASGAGNINFYKNSSNVGVSGTGANNYSLIANFGADSKFVDGLVSITGTTPGISGVAGTTTTGLLFSADLTDFGFANSQLGFKTSFNPSWATNETTFTGGSTAEVLYLYDQVGLATGHGSLTALTNALTAGNLGGVSGATFHGVQSIASVPLPLPVVLFGTGLTALMGFARKRRNSANSI